MGFTLTAAVTQAQSVTTTQLQLQILKMRNYNGALLISVYNSKEGFPKNPEQAFLKFKVPATQAQQILIPNLPVGDYAVAIAHDENGNDRIDTGFLGIPKEGVGFSNNPAIDFGPPSFKEAHFIVPAEGLTLQIKTKYY